MRVISRNHDQTTPQTPFRVIQTSATSISSPAIRSDDGSCILSSFLRASASLLQLIPQSTPSKSRLHQQAASLQKTMFASAIEAGDFVFGHLCGSVVSVVGHAVPSVSEFLNWDIEDLGPIVPEWSV